MNDTTPVTAQENQTPESQQSPAPAETAAPEKRRFFQSKKTKKPPKSLGREIAEWVLTILTAIVLAFVIRTFIGEMVRVDGNSMYATLHDGEVMVVDKTRYATAVLPFNLGNYALGGEPQRFDVIVCHYPGRGNTNFVKRIVGLPGDVLSLVNGYLYVNGVKYEENYLVNRPDYRFIYVQNRTLAYQEYTVPEGKYFVLGDNRSNSNDSHLIGPIDRNMVIGRVASVILPFGNRRSIPNGLEDTQPRRL